MRLVDKCAVITGAGTGIGRTIALLFAREGARVAVVDAIARTGRETVRMVEKAHGEGVFVKADVAKSNEVRKAVTIVEERYGKIDILVNNAGICIVRPLAALREKDWDKSMEVNLKGTFLFCKYVAGLMKGSGGGAIVTISSGLGLYGGAYWSAYCASKGGIIALTKALAIELAEDNIRVNCVVPGPVNTEMLARNTFKQAKLMGLKGPEEVKDLMKQMIPIHRIGEPEDVACAVIYLASDEASYVTGIALPVDGGYLAT